MSKIITISFQKGGVGKTTTAFTLCEGIRLAGKSVLCLDFDPQAHLSNILNDKPEYMKANGSTYSLLKIGAAVPFNQKCMFYSPDFTDYSFDYQLENNREKLFEPFHQLLKTCNFDYVIIDTMPSQSTSTIIAQYIADIIIIPIELSDISIASLNDTFDSFAEMGLSTPYKLLPNKYNMRRSSDKLILDMLKDSFNGKVLPSIPNLTSIKDIFTTCKVDFSTSKAGSANNTFVKNVIEWIN